MFNPNLGRWMTLDPIGYRSGDVNLFRGVGNNPTNFVDPMGLTKKPGTGNGKIADVQKDLKENHGESRYWICIFTDGPKENPDGDAFKIKRGHSWIGVVDTKDGTSVVRGFHPKTEVSSSTPEAEGVLKDDSARAFAVARCFPITEKNYMAWVAEFAKLDKGKLPKYHVRSHNCTNWAVSMMSYSFPEIARMPTTTVNFGVDENSTATVLCPSHLSCYLAENNCGVKESVCIEKITK